MSVEAAMGAMGLGALGSIINNERNLSFQRENQDFMRGLQERVFQREDNAVQRRVADLKAAGLSPVLAAGSAASASGPIKIDPLHSDDTIGAGGALAGLQALNHYAQTASSIATAEAQRSVLLSQAELNRSKDAILGEEFNLYKNAGGHPRYQDIWGKRIAAALDGLRKMQPSLKVIGDDAKRRAAKNWERADMTPAERAKEEGKWHLFNQF